MSNLKLDHPELINQWHLNNKPMETYTSGSGQKVLWICDKNNCGCHEWKARIYDRTRTDGKKNNCPYCNKRKACIHNNAAIIYPNLIQEWHPKNKETLL